jgi:type IV fimbrial biogenesis protein FimT
VTTPANNTGTARRPAPRRAQRVAVRVAGYTMIEMLVVLLIIGIVAASMGPNLAAMVDRNRKLGAVNDMLAVLTLARSEAVNLQTTVSVCSSSDQATCNTNNWESGWLVFVDDGAGTGGVADDGNLNGTEQVLRIGQGVSGTITVRLRNFTDAGAISFDDDGMAVDRGTIVLCDDTGPAGASAIVLNLSGQSRLAVDEDDNNTLDEDDGTEVDACP